MKNLKKLFGLLVLLATMFSCAAVDEAKANDPWQNLMVGDIIYYDRTIYGDETVFKYDRISFHYKTTGTLNAYFDDSLLGKMTIDMNLYGSLHSFLHAGFIAGASWQFDNDTTATYKKDNITNSVFSQTFSSTEALAAGVDINADGGSSTHFTITYYPEGYERNIDHSYTYYFEGHGNKAVLTRISTETITGA